MIIFRKIRYKNFLSSGDNFTEINFQKNDNVLVIGSNGAGKSTMLDALTFVLFNKPFRKINKPQLVNTITEKNCLVEIEFSIGSKEYLVRRGIKPNIFDIEVNGELLDKRGDDRDNQALLEETILKVNFKSFTQIVILGSSTFVPFMQLSAAHRREVIEDLLDIRVFSTMNGITKDRLRALRDELKILDLEKSSLEDKVEMQENFIEQVMKSGEETIDVKKDFITGLLFKKNQLENDNIQHLTDLEELNAEMSNFSEVGDKLKKLGTLRGKIHQKISTLTKEHKFFKENSTCPTCTQSIEEEFRQTKLTEFTDNAKVLKDGFQDIEKTIKEFEEKETQFIELSKKATELNKTVTVNSAQTVELEKQIQFIESEIESIRDQMNNQSDEKEKLNYYKKSLDNTCDKISSKKTDFTHYNFVFNLLKDSGVKTNIIRKYLPFMNQQVNRYLQLMDFYINFNLDEEFNETIQSPIHDKFSYSSFSEGEKMRIDLALLFTWREVARVRNSVNTNLLIMDEVFDSSLDGFGTEEFLKIIRYVVKDANIFIISHKTELHERFDSVLKFEKDRGFSKLVEVAS